MKFLTDFGDLAVLLPLSALIGLWLASRSPRAAGWWLVGFALCAGGTALLKVGFVACSPFPALQSPSGHASLATLVYGALGGMAVLRWEGWRRGAVAAAAGAFVAAIALSRIVLGHHAPLEVALGLALGGSALVLFLRGYALAAPRSPSLPALLAISVLIVGALHGKALHAEGKLHSISSSLLAPVCNGATAKLSAS